MEYIISFIWIGLELLSILLFFASFLARKEVQYAGWIVLAFDLALYCFNNLGPLQPIAPYVRYLGVYVLSMLLFSGRWYIHLLLEVVSVLFILIVDTAFMYGASILLDISLSEFVWRKLTYSVVGTVGKLCLLFGNWMIYRLRKTNGMRGVQMKWTLLTMFFPIVSILLLALNYYNFQGTRDISLGVFSISLILALANVAIVYLIHSLEKTMVREQEMALLRLQMTHQKENYMALEKSYSMQRKASHEFERHIRALSGLLAQEAYGTAKEYTINLLDNPNRQIVSIHSRNPIVDVILNQKYQQAKELGIKMHVHINDLSPIQIQTDSLVVLLGNLLDNAIEACDALKEGKEIYCTILCDETLYMSVRNTSKPVIVSNNKVIFEKSGDIEHGYGIPAVKYVLDQLNAEYTFEYSQGWFQFVADIPIMTKATLY